MNEEYNTHNISPERAQRRNKKKRNRRHRQREVYVPPTPLHSEERVSWFDREPSTPPAADEHPRHASFDAAVPALSSVEEKLHRPHSDEPPQRKHRHRHSVEPVDALTSVEERPWHPHVQTASRRSSSRKSYDDLHQSMNSLPRPLTSFEERPRTAMNERPISNASSHREARRRRSSSIHHQAPPALSSVEERPPTVRDVRHHHHHHHDSDEVLNDEYVPLYLSSVEERAPRRRHHSITSAPHGNSHVEDDPVPLHSEEEVPRKRRKRARRRRSTASRPEEEERHQHDEVMEPYARQREVVDEERAAAVPPADDLGMQELGILLAPRSHNIVAHSTHLRDRVASQRELSCEMERSASFEASDEEASVEERRRSSCASLNLRRPSTMVHARERELCDTPKNTAVLETSMMEVLSAKEHLSCGLFSDRSEDVEMGDERELDNDDGEDAHVVGSSRAMEQTPVLPMNERSIVVGEQEMRTTSPEAKEMMADAMMEAHHHEEDERAAPEEAAFDGESSVNMEQDQSILCDPRESMMFQSLEEKAATEHVEEEANNLAEPTRLEQDEEAEMESTTEAADDVGESCVLRQTPQPPRQSICEYTEVAEMASNAPEEPAEREDGGQDAPLDEEAHGDVDNDDMMEKEEAYVAHEEGVDLSSNAAPEAEERETTVQRTPSPVAVHPEDADVAQSDEVELRSNGAAEAEEHVADALRASPEYPSESTIEEMDEVVLPHNPTVEPRVELIGGEENIDDDIRSPPRSADVAVDRAASYELDATDVEEAPMLHGAALRSSPILPMSVECATAEECVDEEAEEDVLPERCTTAPTAEARPPTPIAEGDHDDVEENDDVAEEDDGVPTPDDGAEGFGQTMPYPEDVEEKPVEEQLPTLYSTDEMPPREVVPPQRVPSASITSSAALQRYMTPVSFAHGYPAMMGDGIRKVLDVGDGALYRIMDSQTSTWAYYNDSAHYTMHVRFSLGSRSVVEPLGNTMMVMDPSTGRFNGGMLVYPGETQLMLTGNVKGLTARYNAWDERALSRRGLSRSPSIATSALPSPRAYSESITTPRALMSEGGRVSPPRNTRYVAPPRRLIHPQDGADSPAQEDQPSQHQQQQQQQPEQQQLSLAAHAAPKPPVDPISREVCFEVESGSLFRITDNNTGNHSFYNDSDECVMRVRFSLGRKSKVTALGRTILETDPVSGKLEGRLYVPPRSTELFLAGHIEGQRLQYNAITI